ncbi:MAG: hypothetical protein AAGB51_06940 [Planctomycetota bacterium]
MSNKDDPDFPVIVVSIGDRAAGVPAALVAEADEWPCRNARAVGFLSLDADGGALSLQIRSRLTRPPEPSHEAEPEWSIEKGVRLLAGAIGQYQRPRGRTGRPGTPRAFIAADLRGRQTVSLAWRLTRALNDEFRHLDQTVLLLVDPDAEERRPYDAVVDAIELMSPGVAPARVYLMDPMGNGQDHRVLEDDELCRRCGGFIFQIAFGVASGALSRAQVGRELPGDEILGALGAINHCTVRYRNSLPVEAVARAVARRLGPTSGDVRQPSQDRQRQLASMASKLCADIVRLFDDYDEARRSIDEYRNAASDLLADAVRGMGESGAGIPGELTMFLRQFGAALGNVENQRALIDRVRRRAQLAKNLEHLRAWRLSLVTEIEAALPAERHDLARDSGNAWPLTLAAVTGILGLAGLAYGLAQGLPLVTAASGVFVVSALVLVVLLVQHRPLPVSPEKKPEPPARVGKPVIEAPEQNSPAIRRRVIGEFVDRISDLLMVPAVESRVDQSDATSLVGVLMPNHVDRLAQLVVDRARQATGAEPVALARDPGLWADAMRGAFGDLHVVGGLHMAFAHNLVSRESEELKQRWAELSDAFSSQSPGLAGILRSEAPALCPLIDGVDPERTLGAFIVDGHRGQESFEKDDGRFQVHYLRGGPHRLALTHIVQGFAGGLAGYASLDIGAEPWRRSLARAFEKGRSRLYRQLGASPAINGSGDIGELQNYAVRSGRLHEGLKALGVRISGLERAEDSGFAQVKQDLDRMFEEDGLEWMLGEKEA